MKILITGKPRSGKTTLIKRISQSVPDVSFGGFYTEEIKEKGRRLGFRLITVNGKSGILAHQNLSSDIRLGNYKLNLETLDTIGIESIKEALKKNAVIIIDEIGKMEILSKKFCQLIEELWYKENPPIIIATIPITPLSFIRRLKTNDAKLLNLDHLGFNEAYNKILELLKLCSAHTIK
jgi:nucleoside-triphosphatase